MSPEIGRVQIADEAINRTPSNGGSGVYAQPRPQRSSSHRSSSLKRQRVSEKELGEEGDGRDLRKAQVS